MNQFDTTVGGGISSLLARNQEVMGEPGGEFNFAPKNEPVLKMARGGLSEMGDYISEDTSYLPEVTSTGDVAGSDPLTQTLQSSGMTPETKTEAPKPDIVSDLTAAGLQETPKTIADISAPKASSAATDFSKLNQSQLSNVSSALESLQSQGNLAEAAQTMTTVDLGGGRTANVYNDGYTQEFTPDGMVRVYDPSGNLVLNQTQEVYRHSGGQLNPLFKAIAATAAGAVGGPAAAALFTGATKYGETGSLKDALRAGLTTYVGGELAKGINIDVPTGTDPISGQITYTNITTPSVSSLGNDAARAVTTALNDSGLPDRVIDAAGSAAKGATTGLARAGIGALRGGNIDLGSAILGGAVEQVGGDLSKDLKLGGPGIINDAALAAARAAITGKDPRIAVANTVTRSLFGSLSSTPKTTTTSGPSFETSAIIDEFGDMGGTLVPGEGGDSVNIFGTRSPNDISLDYFFSPEDTTVGQRVDVGGTRIKPEELGPFVDLFDKDLVDQRVDVSGSRIVPTLTGADLQTVGVEGSRFPIEGLGDVSELENILRDTGNQKVDVTGKTIKKDEDITNQKVDVTAKTLPKEETGQTKPATTTTKPTTTIAPKKPTAAAPSAFTPIPEAAPQQVSRPGVVKDAYEVLFGAGAPSLMGFTKAERAKQILARKGEEEENQPETAYDRLMSMAEKEPVGKVVDQLMKIIEGA